MFFRIIFSCSLPLPQCPLLAQFQISDRLAMQDFHIGIKVVESLEYRQYREVVAC